MVVFVMVMWFMVVMGLDDWHNWCLDNGRHNWFHVGGVVNGSVNDGWVGVSGMVVMWIFADDAGVVFLDVRVRRGDHFAVVRHGFAMDSVVDGLV